MVPCPVGTPSVIGARLAGADWALRAVAIDRAGGCVEFWASAGESSIPINSIVQAILGQGMGISPWGNEPAPVEKVVVAIPQRQPFRHARKAEGRVVH